MIESPMLLPKGSIFLFLLRNILEVKIMSKNPEGNISFVQGEDGTWNVRCDGNCPSTLPILDFDEIIEFDQKNNRGGGKKREGFFYRSPHGSKYGPFRSPQSRGDFLDR
jgi:hypothetical protein